MARKGLLSVVVVAATLGLAAAQGATWQDTHKALRVGFLASDGAAYDLKRLEPFRAYLEASIGMPVELVPAVTYAALIDAEATDRVQYAIHSATSFVTTAARCACVQPLAVPSAFDGASGFHAILLARADSDITTATDVRGKTVAATSDDSVAGHLVPFKALAAGGVDPTRDLKSVVVVTDPAQAAAALLSGNADIAVGWSSLTGDAGGGYDFGSLTGLVKAGTLSMDKVRIVWQSPLIPFGPHAVRNDVPDDIKMRLLTALTSMATAAPGALDAVDRTTIGGGGFVPVSAADFAVIADLIGTTAVAAAPSPQSAAPAVPAPINPVTPPVSPPSQAVPAPLTNP